MIIVRMSDEPTAQSIPMSRERDVDNSGQGTEQANEQTG